MQRHAAATEKVQHRRHRPVYLAPSAMDFQPFSTRSYDSYGNESYEDENSVEDLMIPLFVEIPQDESLRLPITSPPCSGGSSSMRSTLYSPGFIPAEFDFPSEDTEYRQNESMPRRIRGKLCRAIRWVYALISDFFLLIFVCVMGLFFHVEVQVVKERARGRRGRVVVQKNSQRRHRHREYDHHREYRSTDLLRPLQQHSSPSNSYLYSENIV